MCYHIIFRHFSNFCDLAFSKEATAPTSTCQGMDATFTCEVLKTVNQTRTSAVWWIGDQMVENSTKYTITFNTTTSLVVHNVSVDDDNGTQYTCSDTDGTISSSTILNVTGKLLIRHTCSGEFNCNQE